MKIYISGKISGLPIQPVIEKFKWHAVFLELKGHESINPFDVSPLDESKDWHDYMIEDIAALFKCEAIYMLKDWGQSRGARIEYQIAKELGLQIFFEGEFNAD
jgi:hypothetical protein